MTSFDLQIFYQPHALYFIMWILALGVSYRMCTELSVFYHFLRFSVLTLSGTLTVDLNFRAANVGVKELNIGGFAIQS